MADKSGIEWTDSTFNAWHGCTKVSPGCQHCYAETLTKRFAQGSYWGPQGGRKKLSDAYWKKPERWARQPFVECDACRWRGEDRELGSRTHDTRPMASIEKEPTWKTIKTCPKCESYRISPTRRRVFSGSMCDIFEDRPDVEIERRELFDLIEATPEMDWLLLTKRPENIVRMVPLSWRLHWPAHAWIGTSVENQELANKRIPELLKVPAALRFLSCEPLLGPINLVQSGAFAVYMAGGGASDIPLTSGLDNEGIHWVIAGGESGPDARIMQPDWARSLASQCNQAGVPFLFKQWGAWLPAGQWTADERVMVKTNGANPTDRRLGKKAAGRLLDGVAYLTFPKSPVDD